MNQFNRPQDLNSIRITGSIEQLTYHNDVNGFSVFKLCPEPDGFPINVVANLPVVRVGERLEIIGEWITNASYGRQFKAQHVRTLLPCNVDGIKKYLGSGMIKGIGPHFAQKLIDKFGMDVLQVIENQPEKLAELDGIGPVRTQKITQSWQEHHAVRDIMVFLHSNGIGTNRAVRIFKTYGKNAIDLITSNPYRLVHDIHGMGFKTVDQLAQRLGLSHQALERASAGINHVMQEAARDGNCALEQDQLIKSAIDLLDIPASIVERALQLELEKGRLVKEQVTTKSIIFSSTLYALEKEIAFHVTRLNNGNPPWEQINIQAALDELRHQGIHLSASQSTAITSVLQHKISIITGGPGVGKTTVVNAILRILDTKKVAALLCAPTGRAAKRLSEATHRSAKTIHRLLEIEARSFKFKHNAENPLKVEFIVADEASMIDVFLMNALLRAIPQNAAILIVGDTDQLPSVGPGCVLSDLIKSETIITTHLTEIFRQAKSSKIIVNAHKINHGIMPDLENSDKELSDFYFVQSDNPQHTCDLIEQMISDRIPNRFHFDPVNEIQVLAPMNRGILGTQHLNTLLQSKLNITDGPHLTRYDVDYRRGDKVMQIVNNYDKEVFNGDIGVIDRFDKENRLFFVDFDHRIVEYEFDELDELNLAYAITIHKSQGSEYPAIVIPIANQHYVLLNRNLIYTAVTRGQKLVVLVGQRQALQMAINNTRTKHRLTNLVTRLKTIKP